MSSGIKTNKNLKLLERPLAEWIRLNRTLGRRWMHYASDCPWWYNERALLSVFVGAVWRTGNAALEEYSEYKRSKTKHTAGRIDLWFSTGNHEFWVEAKACEVPITRISKQAETIKEVMAQAKEDVCRLKPDGYTRRLAMTFVAPYLTKGHEEKFADRISEFIDLVKCTRPDAMAWVFPNLKKLPKYKNWVSPGIMVLIKEVKRGLPS